MNLTKARKKNREEFDKYMIKEYGNWRIGRAEAKSFLSQAENRIIEGLRELVEEIDFYGWDEKTQRMIREKLIRKIDKEKEL